MVKTGETPGKGSYKCTRCGTIVTLDKDTDVMPPCPKCHNKTFTKV